MNHKHLLLFSIMIILSCNSNSSLDKKWKKNSYLEDLYNFYLNGTITCQQYLSFATYTSSKNELDGLTYRRVFGIIESKNSRKSINLNYDFDILQDIEADLLVLGPVSAQFEIELHVSSSSDQILNIHNVVVDIWLSENALLGSYTFNTVKSPKLNPNSQVKNSLFIPISILKEDLTIRGINLSPENYSCLMFKLKSIDLN